MCCFFSFLLVSYAAERDLAYLPYSSSFVVSFHIPVCRLLLLLCLHLFHYPSLAIIFLQADVLCASLPFLLMLMNYRQYT